MCSGIRQEFRGSMETSDFDVAEFAKNFGIPWKRRTFESLGDFHYFYPGERS